MVARVYFQDTMEILLEEYVSKENKPKTSSACYPKWSGGKGEPL